MMRVYELRHPRTGRPVYVGLTKLTLEERLYAHHSDAGGSALVRTWLRRVRGAPTVALVATARTKREGERLEGEHIKRLWKRGFVLLNQRKNPGALQWQSHGKPSGIYGYLRHPGPCSICRRARLDTVRGLL